MTKRTLYAVAELPVPLLLAAAGMVTLLLASPFVPPAAAQGAVCATCVAVAVTPEQAASLPLQLDGMEVLLRIPPPGDETAAAALALIAQRGGRPGVFLQPMLEPGPDASVLAETRRVVIAIDPPAAGQAPEEYAFRLKTRLTAIRAAAPATLML